MTIELHNAPSLPEPQGYSHASVAPPGSIVHLAGQIGQRADGSFADGLTGQTAQALANVVAALAAAGAGPDHLAKLTVYVVGWNESMQGDLFAGMVEAAQTTPLPQVPITLIGVQALYVEAALIEIEGVAVVAG